VLHSYSEIVFARTIDEVAAAWRVKGLLAFSGGYEDADGRRVLATFGFMATRSSPELSVAVINDGVLAEVELGHNPTGGRIWNGDDVTRKEFQRTFSVKRVIGHSDLVKEVCDADFEPSERQIEAMAVDVLNLGLDDIESRLRAYRDAKDPGPAASGHKNPAL
jgi:hypothetical protein